MDYTYIVLLIPAMIFALVAQARVKSAFNKYSQVGTRKNLSGAEAALSVLRANGVFDVSVERTGGSLTDHYDPRENVIFLSESVYDSRSVSAVGVASHEAGHAVQYAEGYSPVKIRSAIIPVCNIGANLSWPLVLIGLVMAFDPLIWAGIILFSTVTFFQLVTLPVEYNASSRALHTMESTGMLYGEENKQAKAVLSAAALTYVAALAVSMANLLRLLSIAGRRNRR